MNKTCLVCNKDFIKPTKLSYKLWEQRMYCSKKCYGTAITGKKRPNWVGEKISKTRIGSRFSEEHKKNLSLSLIGRTTWNKGKRGLQTAWNKGIPMKKESKEKITGENNYNWKVDGLGYSGIHRWITRVYGKADHCEFSSNHKKTTYEWANVSGQYLRDIDDWTQLCSMCHRQYDHLRGGRFISNYLVSKFA